MTIKDLQSDHFLPPVGAPLSEPSLLALLSEAQTQQTFGPSLLDGILADLDAQYSPYPARAAAYGLLSSLPRGADLQPVALPLCLEGHCYLHGMCLSEHLIMRLFAGFTLQGVELTSERTATVFMSAQEADVAIPALNGKGLVDHPGLMVRFVPSAWHDRPLSGGVRKYTCRFDIGIENDKDFHVARRIIGQKGANMKKIVKQAAFDAKLRLRGRGSGFLEGVNKQESDEPLHLCVSCKDPQGYATAVALVTSLLDEIYQEYRSLASKGFLPPRDDLKVNILEHPLLYSSSSAIPLQQPEIIPCAPVLAVSTPEPLSEDESDPPSDAPDIGEIERLIEERNEARRVCNFKEADRIRDLLRAAGVGLMDEPGGRGKGTEVTTWRYWRC